MFRVVCRRLWVNRRCQAGINCRFEVTQRFFTSEDSPIEAEGYRDLQVLTRHQKQQYERLGYLVVPDVFSKDHIEQMRKELDGYIERQVIKFGSLFQGSACSVKDQRH
ncbi:uncharacterized protein LOC113680257 [Pocillopora damicornis]|uniref:uncharacterized protein LOC113680257 n=1 Tax=Pocillopora damicornis TaxID=46731 RepID=UPI000F54D5C5|nr:uncharacterized protein LOC113680257 [Pocillopora damicornis]